MLSFRQVCICTAVALAFWVVATLAIHFGPGAFTDPLRSTIGFVVSFPVGWLCVRLTRRLAAVKASQVATACLVVLAVATSIDGAALRYFPQVYSADESTCRLAAAWLLWGYGAAAFAALVMAARPTAAVLSQGG